MYVYEMHVAEKTQKVDEEHKNQYCGIYFIEKILLYNFCSYHFLCRSNHFGDICDEKAC